MNLNPQNKNHRIVILILIAVPMLIIGAVIVTIADNSVEKEAVQIKEEEKSSSLQAPERPPHFSAENTNEMTEEEKEEAKAAALDEEEVNKENMKASKEIAEKFAQGFLTYDAGNPDQRYENVKAYIGGQMKSDWEESPPRTTMVISKITPLEYETYPVEGGSNYEIAWNVVVTVENTSYTGKKSQSEEWLWIYLSKEDDAWKVQRMDITNG